VIPGSHKRGPLEPTIKEGWMLDLATHAEERAAESVEVPAGGASIHHCCLLHSSLPNRSSRPRRAFIVQYAAGDNFPIAGRTDYAGYGTFLRGSNPWRVRSVGGHWHMSPPRRRDRQHQ
jgi:ectoine hydroxylase-related dioxygenase (phytanoyl-CoA dioxygenase family)